MCKRAKNRVQQRESLRRGCAWNLIREQSRRNRHALLRRTDNVSRIHDVATSVIFQFCSTFAVWMLAERLHLFAILTMVVFAMALSRPAAQTLAAERSTADDDSDACVDRHDRHSENTVPPCPSVSVVVQ